MADRDILEALVTELEEGKPDLAAAFSIMTAIHADPAELAAAGYRYADYLRRFAQAAEMLDVGALSETAHYLEENSRAFSGLVSTERVEPERHRLFEEWPDFILAVLRTPSDEAAIVNTLQAP